MERSVAIIGGGISGLVCAARLKQLNMNNVTVFDTGKHGPGGRCSSRTINVDGNLHTFDHSAQYFTVSDQRFAKIVSFLHKQGAVKIWNGKIGHLKEGKFTQDDQLTQAFIGSDGMVSIPKSLASLVQVKGPSWIAHVEWDSSLGKWKVDKYGYFNYLVIAHNGKCADNLMSNAGVPNIHHLLQVRFSDTLNMRENKMQLCSIWALLVAFPSSLKLPYVAAHVEDNQISWIANNTSKMVARATLGKSVECWTIFSTKSFASANKVPQEHIPPAKAKDITNTLLTAFGRVTRIYKQLPPPCFTRVQLWGAAVPLNVLQNKEECVFDGQNNIGICGDWLVSPCIQGAAISGLALAEKIHNNCSGSTRNSTDLLPRFKPADSETIGAFPSNPEMIFNPK
ncbi:renalase-like [Mytilus edulis]|uniref:renalase-like n=1 Tax=Mytilus edulis TaxID=6550 RepID=UPI0039EE0F72